MRKVYLSFSVFLLATLIYLVNVHGQSGPQVFTMTSYATYTTNALLRPTAVYINPSSPTRLFISDSGHNQVDQFYSGQLTVLAGSGSSGFQDGALRAATFKGVTGITGPGYSLRCGGPGCVPSVSTDLFVVDTLNNAIRHVCLSQPGNGSPAPTCYPSGVTTVSGGSQGYRDGTGTQAQFSSPGAFGSSLTLQGQLVTDLGNNAVRSLNATSTTASTAFTSPIVGYANGPLGNAQFHGVTSLASVPGSPGFTLLTDTGNFVVRKLDSGNSVSTFAGNGVQGYADGPPSTAQFAMPLSAFYNGADRFTYIADALNNCIRRVDAAGNVSTYAGQRTGGLKDGALTAAQFSNPTSITIAGGFMYIADTNNNAIRRIDMTNNVVSTLLH